MTLEILKELINQLKRLNEYYNKYEEFSIDLFEGKAPVGDAQGMVLDLFLKSLYTEKGMELFYWFIFENDCKEGELKYDEDGDIQSCNLGHLYLLLDREKL